MSQNFRDIKISLQDIEIRAITSQGAGGQNVNKVATAIQLRFDIRASSLPDSLKQRLLERQDQRITRDGVIVIKAQTYRTQEQNRAAALRRLQELVASASYTPAKRKPTRPGKAARARRLDSKTRRGQVKTLRRKIDQP